jgi:hypothetical protein
MVGVQPSARSRAARPFSPTCAPLLAVLATVGCVGEASDQAGSAGSQRSALTAPNVDAGDYGLDPGSLVAPPWGVGPVAMATGDGIHMLVGLTLPMTGLRVRASDNTPLSSFSIGTETGPCKAGGPDHLPPVIAFAGGYFLVVWNDYRTNLMGYDSICAARVRPDGTVLGTPALRIRGPDVDPVGAVTTKMAVRGSETSFLVAWSDTRYSGLDVDLSAFGLIVGASPVPSTSGGLVLECWSQRTKPSVGSDGKGWLVACDPEGGSGTIRASRLDPSGVTLEKPWLFGIQAGIGQRPEIVFDGTNYQVMAIGADKLSRVRIRPGDGMKLDATPVDVVLGTGTTSPSILDPALAFDGTNMGLLWRGTTETARDRARVHFMRFTPEGKALETPVVLDDAPPGCLDCNALGAADGKFLAAWSGSSSVRPVELVSVDGTTGAKSVLGTDVWNVAPPQGAPTVSFDGKHHLLTFNEYTGSGYKIRAARVRESDGELLDPLGLDLTSDAVTQQRSLAGASNGANHLVMWPAHGGEARAVRVRGEDGAVLDDPPLVLPSTPNGWFAVESDGQDYLIWAQEPLPLGQFALVGVRVRGADGTILDTTPRRLLGPIGAAAHLAFVDSHYVASYGDLSSPPAMLAQRFDRGGTPVGAPVTLAMAAGSRRVVPMGDLAMVLWSDGPAGPLWARRLRVSDGGLPDPGPIKMADKIDFGWGNARFDGENVLLAFTRDETQGSQFPQGTAVWMARLTPTGTLLDPQGAIVVDDPYWAENSPALSPVSPGRTLVAYNRKVPGPGGAPPRVRWRWVDTHFPPPSDAAADAPGGRGPLDAATGDGQTQDTPGPTMEDASLTEPSAAVFDASPPADSNAQDTAPLGRLDSGTDSALDLAAVERPGDGAADVGAVLRNADGCGCHLGGSATSARGGALIGLFALAIIRRRTRRR